MGIVSATDMTYWLLGDTFLTGYYSIYDNSDHDNARVGFAPHATSSKPVLVENSSIPSTRVEDVLWELSWVFSVWHSLGQIMAF